MRVFTHTGFTGHYPVGVAAIIVAEYPYMALGMLNEELRQRGLPGNAQPEDLMEVDLENESCEILMDGNY